MSPKFLFSLPSLKHITIGLVGASALALSGCTVPDEEKDPGASHNAYFQSPEFLALLNDSVGKPHGVPAPVVKINKLGTVSLRRLSEIGINFEGNPPENMSRYVELQFKGDSNEGGVIAEIEAGVGHGPIIYWVSDAQILAHLAKTDEESPKAIEGKQKANAQFDNPEIATCAARITAQGFEEEYPFEVWHYCQDPTTPKDLTPHVNGFLRKIGLA